MEKTTVTKKCDVIIRKCQWCGEEYAYTQGRWYDYCSPKCKYQAECAKR